MPYKKKLQETEKLIDDLIGLWCEDYMAKNYHIFENNTVVKKVGNKFKAITKEDMFELGKYFYYMGVKTIKGTNEKGK